VEAEANRTVEIISSPPSSPKPVFPSSPPSTPKAANRAPSTKSQSTETAEKPKAFHYFRFNPIVTSEAHAQLDMKETQTINELIQITKDYLAQSEVSTRMQQLVDLLLNVKK
jgi:hypothetical protein